MPRVHANGRFQRSKLYGVGINDLPYPIQTMVNGKRVIDPAYRRWSNLLARCQEWYQTNRPWYKGTTICDEWLSASNFKAWVDAQEEDLATHQIDKDILVPGNKVYGPDTCVLVTPEVNKLFSFRNTKTFRTEGNPLGVFYVHGRKSKPYASEIRRLGYTPYKKRLGYFATPEEAAVAYNTAKKEHILEVKSKQTNPKVIDALQWWHDNWDTIVKDL